MLKMKKNEKKKEGTLIFGNFEKERKEKKRELQRSSRGMPPPRFLTWGFLVKLG